MDLSAQISSLSLKNPLIAASGCFGYGVEYADLVDLSTLGAVAVKGLFLTEREGHAPPRIVETPAGMLNAIGLQGIGVYRFVDEILPELFARRATVIVNVCGTTLDEYFETRRPKISNVVGGLSGPAIRPIAVRMVYECRQAVKIPIIGIGGIADARDVLEFMIAGATAVQIGTANFVDPLIWSKVMSGLED